MAAHTDSESAPAKVELADFVRQERDHILRRWEKRARRSAVARSQPRAALLDSLPALLERIAEMTATSDLSPCSISGRHALERLEQGYSLGDVVNEYTELRACVLERLGEVRRELDLADARVLNLALDSALRETVRRYADARERLLGGLERVSREAFGKHTLDELLDHILSVLKETAGAEVDCVAVMLLGADGRLHMRATIGLEEDLAADFSVAVGAGFAGRIAEERQPLLLRDATNEPLLLTDRLRARGTRALYGVPLLDGDDRIGVAFMGSNLANGFSEEDMILFRSLADRATALIVRTQLIERLERAAHFRDQFIAVLGHDLRSPLGAIAGTAQLLLTENGLTEPQRRGVMRIARSSSRMQRLIEDILDFTRAQLGDGFPLERETFSLRALAWDVVDEVGARSPDREIRLDARDPATGSWDRNRLAQVLANLLNNAVQYSSAGTTIDVTVRADAHEAVVEVKNHGEPIAPAMIPVLFEPFQRGTEAGGRTSLGLGLFIAAAIVRAHGGTIDARSDAQDGTVFVVRLPREPPAKGA